MKMRVFWLIFFAVFVTQPLLLAQPGKYGNGPDSVECRRNLSFYRDYVRNGDIMSAVPSWRIALAVCPRTANQYPYLDGQQTIIKTLMKQPGVSPQYMAALVDSLMLMYDIRLQYYSASVNVGLLLQNKIMDLTTYKPDAKEERMAVLESLLNTMGNTTPPNMLARYMELVGSLYADGKRTADDVMDAYSRLAEILDVQERGNPENEEIKSIKVAIENYLINTGVATCDNLISLFTPRFQANSNDLDLVSKITYMLTISGCETSDLYLQSVTALNKLAPSYKTAYYLSNVHASKNEYTTAIKYLQEAIDNAETPATDKGKYLVQQGTMYLKMNNSARAMAAAKAAVEATPAVKGKAYMLMANIWAGFRCGETDIEKRAPFWVAVDFLEKAKAADPSCAEEANKFIAQYRGYFPLQEEAFMYDLTDGSSYTVVCSGMTEKTTVRTKK